VQTSELVARIGFEDDVTEEEADRHTRDLVLLLEGLDVDEVRTTRAEDGDDDATRAADVATLAGTVLVTGALLRPVLTSVVSLVGTWLEQSGQRSVTVEVGDAKVTVTGRVPARDVENYVRVLRGDAAPSADGAAEDAG
jgi:hypothetical protein